jgi:hypothetical protein
MMAHDACSAAPHAALSCFRQLVRSEHDPDVHILASADPAAPAWERAPSLFLDPGGTVLSFLSDWMKAQRVHFLKLGTGSGDAADADADGVYSTGLFISGPPKARARRGASGRHPAWLRAS